MKQDNYIETLMKLMESRIANQLNKLNYERREKSETRRERKLMGEEETAVIEGV
jgi:hypothetical protein